MGFRHAEKEDELQSGVHPVWRTVGCIMAVLIPIIGFTGSLLLIQYNQQYRWVQIPSDFINQTAGGDPYLYIKIGLTLIISFLLYIIFMLVTFVINSAFGPKHYSPVDAPQQKFRGGDYKR
jgi:hypothetical protein